MRGWFRSNTVRRYHGLHAQLLRSEGEKIIFKLVDRDGEITYDPSAEDVAGQFYTGELVAGNVVRGGLEPGSTGAVFMNLAALTTLRAIDEELPKLPPSAGL